MSEGRVMYKVVRCHDTRYWSVVASKSLLVEYKPGEWVESRIGGLLVFERLSLALLFSEDFPFVSTVWECEVDEELPLPPYMLDSRIFTRSAPYIKGQARLAWSGSKRPRWGRSGWPYGTRAFKRVKLLRPVTDIFGRVVAQS